MKKANKACIICMSLLACGALCGGVATMQYASADAPSVVIDGASVRMKAPTGIRFETTAEKVDGYNYGTLIIPKSQLNGELTENTQNVLNAPVSTWQTETGYSVVLGGANGANGVTEFPQGKYNETLVARSYAEKDGAYTYSNTVERTLAWVASASLATPDEVTGEDKRGFLEDICDYVLGDDGFAFASTEILVTGATVDLTQYYAQSNGAEGMVAIWSTSAKEVATVDENGVVTMVADGSATITAQIGTKTASVTVKSAAEIAGTVTNAADGEGKVELYDEAGAYIGSFATTISGGAYSVALEKETAASAVSAIVSQGANAAFIDDLSASKDGAMINASYRVGNATLNGKTINSTDSTYATAKASASGNWSYTTAHSGTYGLIMPATATAENYSYTTQMTKTLQGKNEAGVGITNGEWVLSFQRSSTTTSDYETNVNGLYGTRIIVHLEKLGTITSYDFMLLCGFWNGNAGFHDAAYLGARNEYGNWYNDGRTDVSGNTASSVRGNAIWTVERTDDSIQLYANPITTGTGLERKLVLTVTADGITLANEQYAGDSYNRLFNSSYGSFEETSNNRIKGALAGFFGENVEHAMAFVSDRRDATSHAVTYKTSVSELHYVSGAITGATDGAANVTLYNESGAKTATYTATVANGKYMAIVDEASLQTAVSAIVTQGVKAGYIDDLSASKDVTIADAYAMNGSTYAAIKDSLDGTFGYTSTADTYTKLNNMTTSGDYEYYFEISANNPNKVNGEAGIVIGNGTYSIRIERLRNSGASTLSIYAFNSAAETAEIHRAYNLTYSYNGNTNDNVLGYHNSAALTQKFKLVREGTKIELYMAGATSDYVHIFTLEYGVGMTIANENFAITNSKKIEGDGMLEAVNAICAEDAINNFHVRTITLTDWQINAGKVQG